MTLKERNKIIMIQEKSLLKMLFLNKILIVISYKLYVKAIIYVLL